MKTKQLLLSAALGLASSLAFASQIVTQWNFQDSSGGTSTANIGTGTITPIGDVTHSGFNSGSGSSDPIQPGSGFQTTSYPSQSTASGTAGIRVDVPTLGFASPAFSSLEVSFDLRTSNTASRWYRLDYTTDGTNWNLGTPSRLGAAANAGDSWHNNNTVQINDLAALNNNNFGFRVVSVFSPDAFTEANSSTNFAANTAYEVARNTTSNYGGGTWRFDMVTVTAIPEPGTFALILLGSVGIVRIARRKK